MAQSEYITTVEVARLLKISISTVTRMAREGRLTAIKVGKLWRFPAQSPGILLYKQEQQAQRKARAATGGEDGEKLRNGLHEFHKAAAELHVIEPFDRDQLYGNRS
jgi:excisionase family DNA binding protein